MRKILIILILNFLLVPTSFADNSEKRLDDFLNFLTQAGEQGVDIDLDDKDFIKKAINIDSNSIKFASSRLRQDKTIAKLIIKKDKKLAKKYIFKKTLKEIE